jgi:thiamine pyrophosphate-dependent acetolactate synthase large subunit-like protein
MTRSLFVKEIMDSVEDNDVVVTSTGFISRAVFEYKDRPLNFYMMGSMGNALGIGLGIAMHVKNKVIVISGDGAVLMSLGSLCTVSRYDLPNLFHHIIDNGMHESTGGQSTGFSDLGLRNFDKTFIHKAGKDPHVPARITLSPEEITARFKNALHSQSIQ